jgi:hypothetical protein
MTSVRFLILVGIYLGGHYFTKYHINDEHPSMLYNPLLVLSVSTFLFFIVIKFLETNCNQPRKGLPATYIFSQSVIYTALAIMSQYIYQFFLEKDCIDTIAGYINNFNEFTYIPEAVFIAGFVLLINNLSLNLIYPICN